MHDKRIADQDELNFPDDIRLFQDSGYQGFKPENVTVMHPFKKPRGRDLNELEKWFNRYVAKIRICVEHAIGGIKRSRIVKDKCRHFCQHFRDLIMDVCVGLHNFRVTSPFRAYKCKKKWA